MRNDEGEKRWVQYDRVWWKVLVVTAKGTGRKRRSLEVQVKE
jgi:hypothetical protein